MLVSNCSGLLLPQSKPCESINDILDLKLSLDTNVVTLGDSLTLNLSFYNLTENDIEFYPKGFITLTHRKTKDVLFVNPPVYDEIQIINKIMDFREKAIILKSDSIKFSYKALVNKEIFFKDTTTLIAKYRIKESKRYNKLNYCGTLISNPVQIKVSTK